MFRNGISLVNRREFIKAIGFGAAELQGMLAKWRKQMNAKMPAAVPRDDFEVWKASRRQ